MGHIINECPLIPDPEMNWDEFPEAFNRAIDTALGFLSEYGIREQIDASLKQFSGNRRCWLALYVRESQFKGTPIFNINKQTPGIIDAAVLPQKMTVEDVMIDSVLHEWGHVLEEYSRLGEGGEEMYSLIYGPFSDEEDFAEYMVDFFRYKKDRARRGVVDKVIKMYVENVF